MTTGGELLLNIGANSSTEKAPSHNFNGHVNSTDMINILKSIVENPNDAPVATNAITQTATTSTLKSALITWSVPFYEYVIITSRALKPAFTQFISWKKRKGYNAGIVCIEDILADPAATGDNISSPPLNDSAGKLRQYLFAGYSNPSPKIKYALLGGDYTIVPIRYGMGYDQAYWKAGLGKIPADLYYSNMNSNWHYQYPAYTDTTYTGVYYNGFNYAPEIFVGRLLCSSENDIRTWTSKVLTYEQKPGNGDYTYLSKSLFTESDEIGTIDINVLPSIFVTKPVWSEQPSDTSQWPYSPKGADVIAELNQHYGLYSNFNHGGPLGFAVATGGLNDCSGRCKYFVEAMDTYDSPDLSQNNIQESNNGFDNLTNTNYPTIIYACSCMNMPFDHFKTSPGFWNQAESYLCISGGGGPALLGNTRDGWSSDSKDLETRFFDSISYFPQLGIAEGKSKIGFNISHGFGHWICLTHNLAGCPETPMWTVMPSVFNNVTITENGSNVTVNTNGVVADNICVMSALNNGFFQRDSIASSATFFSVPKPYYVTITKKNYIPYLYNPSAIYIQNQNISSTAYLNCQTVSAGYNVDPTQTLGNVVIQNGANIVFDCTGDILLDKGFEVQLGAYFEAK